MAVLLVAAALAGCASAPLIESTASVQTISTEPDPRAFSLGPNDVLSVSVYGYPELSTPRVGTYVGSRIGPDGELSLPLVGAVQVGGMRLDEAREAVTAAFRPYVTDPRVDLSVVEWSARRFYLYGEVRNPGAYPMDRPLTAYQGLALGGGYQRNARSDEIVLLRGAPEALEVYVIDGRTPDPSGMIALRPDDFLFVRKSGAGNFADEVLPVLTGISSSLGSLATILLIEDRLKE
jgi:polysaccharide export outer membrane protein